MNITVVKLSVSAITSKSLQVTFSKAVDDTKAAFELKKDGFKVNSSNISFSADKKTATIELTSKITKGEYSVSVTGVTDETLTGSVKTEDEKVAKIEVLSNEIPLTNLNAGSTADDVSVPYKVTNQYGEDITKTASVVTSSGTVDQAHGVINFLDGYNTTTNKTVAFTLINVDSNVSTSAVVTAVSSSVESSVEIKGVYNKDGKTLNETTDLSKDKFFLEVEVKDQYGKVISNPNASSLLVSESNNTIIDVDDSTQTPALDTTTVDGKVLIPLTTPVAGLKAGSSTVTLIAKNTGKSSSTNVTVAEGVRAYTVTLGQPELVAAGEDALIPVTALDNNGNEITDLDVLNSPTRGLNVGVNTLVKVDGKVYLKVSNPSVGPNVAVVTVVPTQKIVTSNYTVRTAAAPSVITGLDKGVQTEISNGLSQDITASDLVIEDQYGRVMSDADVNAWLDANAGNSIVLKSSVDSSDKSPFEVTTSASGSVDTATQVITASTANFNVSAKTAGDLNNTEKLTFALSTNGGTSTIASTSKDVVFSRVAVSEFASYEVSTPSLVENKDASAFSLKVYGVKANGSKTLLNSSDYNLVLPTGFTKGGTNNNTVTLTNALTDIDDDATTTDVPQTKDFTFKVVVADANATTLTKVVKVSAAAKADASVGVTSNGASTGTALTALTYEASTSTNDSNIVDLTGAAGATDTLDLSVLENNLYYVDQYGNETVAPSGDVVLTFSNLVDADTTHAAAISDNGTSSAAVSGLEAGDTVKVKVEVGNLPAKTFTVTIK
ncbi:hypothetical protein [Bacillus sp. MUM 13]|uniref:hypothetical protein n=1 Tax=Bacillus sp. MUM 13 TaxID=1678001 RepID=UPI0008F586BD|nr:hypothetical protein [Bacillus sp. MUM 13]OIK10066.1 hypothetical protein BIV59_15130 [Bacillus sp. MUM 13]